MDSIMWVEKLASSGNSKLAGCMANDIMNAVTEKIAFLHMEKNAALPTSAWAKYVSQQARQGTNPGLLERLRSAMSMGGDDLAKQIQSATTKSKSMSKATKAVSVPQKNPIVDRGNFLKQYSPMGGYGKAQPAVQNILKTKNNLFDTLANTSQGYTMKAGV